MVLARLTMLYPNTALHQDILNFDIGKDELINTLFSGNTASEQGANIFGGLLDRCIPSPFAGVYEPY